MWGAVALFAMVLLVGGAPAAEAASAREIDARVDFALNRLLAESPAARAVAERTVAALVFPDVVTVGFGFGGQYGEGAWRGGGATAGYHALASASFGAQAGAQSCAQALFFMTECALDDLRRSEGFELGGNSGVTVIDEEFGADLSRTTLRDPIVAFTFAQRGVMADISVEGAKITSFAPR